jgi:hypothetical protein
MLTWKMLVPAVIVPTAVCLTAQTSLSGAAEECRTRPGLSTPRGSHWYYRLSRPDLRHCWYLAAEGRDVRAHGRGADAAASEPGRPMPKRSAPDAEPPRPSADAWPVQAALSPVVLMAPGPADVAVPEPPVRETETATEFAARWPSPSGVRHSHDGEAGTTQIADAEQQAPAAAAETSVRPVAADRRADPASEDQEVPQQEVLQQEVLQQEVRQEGLQQEGLQQEGLQQEGLQQEGLQQELRQQEALQTASLAGGAALAFLFFAGWIVKAGGRSRLRLGAELAEIGCRRRPIPLSISRPVLPNSCAICAGPMRQAKRRPQLCGPRGASERQLHRPIGAPDNDGD